MFGEEELHHVILAVVREIDVDVRQLVERHPFRVQEALEIKVKADRADARNAQAIADQRIGRAAARDPLDAPRAALLQNLPHDQEVRLVADGGDDVQLLLDLRGELRGALAVTAAQALHHEPVQEGARGGTVRGMEVRELRFAEGEFKIAALRDFERVPEPFGMLLAGGGHFPRNAEVEPPAVALLRVRLPEQRQRADALDDVVFLSILGRGVVNRRSRDCTDCRLEAGGVASG